MNRIFCVFCWRAISSTGVRKGRTKYFCNHHKASEDNKLNHEQQKRWLISSLELNGVLLSSKLTKQEYYDTLSDKILSKLTVHPSITLDKFPYPSIGLLKQSTVIIDAVEWAYPITYKKLKHLKDEDPITKIDFAEKVISSLADKIELKRLPIRSIDLKIDKDAIVWIPLLIEMVARHEALMLVNEKKLRSGPPSGVLKDHDLRRELVRLVYYYRDKKLKPTQRELAKRLGKSKQRISVLMKELGLTNKV
jgi:hypothetical protein